MITTKLFNKILNPSCLKHDFIRNTIRLSHIQCYNCSVNLANFQLETKLSHKFRNYENDLMIIKRPSHSITGSYISEKFSNAFNKVFGITRLNQKRAGFNLYLTLDQVDIVELYKLLKLEDTFYSWYKVTELHVWMMLVRLMQDGHDYRYVRKFLVCAMWEDLQKRAKAVGPMNKKFKDNMKEFAYTFKTALFCYDEGFLSNDMVLCNAVWVQFFEKKCDDPRILEAMVYYIRYQINHLQLLDTKEEALEQINRPVWAPFAPIFKEVN